MIDVDDRIARTSATEGAGVVSSYADFSEAVHRPQRDAGEIAAAGAGLGLDMLGAAMNPLGTLAEAGVGWLIEHIDFLREPLDRLCGEPLEIGDRAKAWHELSQVLDQQGQALLAAVDADVATWEGDAAQAYRTAAGVSGTALSSLASDAVGVSDAVLQSGAMVGLERSLIRDQIASWLVQVIAWIGASIMSAGLALSVAIPSTVAEAARMALRFADTVEQIVRVLDEVGDAVTALAKSMDKAARQARKVGEAGEKLADHLTPSGSQIDGLKNLRGRLENLAGQNLPKRWRDAEPSGSTPDVGSSEGPAPGRRPELSGLDGFEDSTVAKPVFDATTDTLVEDGKQQAKVRNQQKEFSEPATRSN